MRQTYRENEDEKINKIPHLLKEYNGLSIFNRGKFEEIEVEKGDVICISEGVELCTDDKAVLRLHTKFVIVQALGENDFDFEQELAYAKVRMERRNDLEREKKDAKNREDENEDFETQPPLLEVITESQEDKVENETEKEKEKREKETEEKMKDEKENEEERREEDEARCRQVFDLVEGVFDDRK